MVGLDKLDQHAGATQGEPGIIYIEGDPVVQRVS